MPKGVWVDATPRLCLVCSSSYLPVRASQRYCSSACGQTQVARRSRRGDLGVRACVRCEQSYRPGRRDQRVCGQQCAGRPELRRDCQECGATYVVSHRGGGIQVYCTGQCREAASRRRRGERFRKYALSELEYLSLVDAQGNCCKACGEPPNDYDRYGLVVDHDHRTGEVRGLLCNRCNMGLGLFDDDPDKLLKAYAYLKAWRLGQPGGSLVDGAGRHPDKDALLSGSGARER